MKLGIALLAIGVAILVISIPSSISAVYNVVFQAGKDSFSSGVFSYIGIIGVVAGIFIIGIGISKIFK
jgi:hypothetical protein